MEVSKQHVLDVLVRVGRRDLVDIVKQTFPETIDLDRDQDLFARHGITKDQLMDRMGSSP